MYQCPVCEQNNDTLLCAGCGFDISCDLERYPTLVKPATLPRSILGRKQLREEENKKMLHCPQCNTTQFRFHLEEGAFLCAQCGHGLPLEQLQLPKFQPPVKKEEPIVQTEPIQQEDDAVTLYNRGSECYYANHYDMAASYFIKAATLGNASAQHSLGYCYQYGQGVDKSLSKAVEYYRLAAAQGHPSAQFNLGFCYYHGHGVVRDYFQAAKYFRQAADQGNTSAQIWLAGCYYHGRGLPQNYTKAVEYYRKAANQGNAYGHKYLGDCYQHGHGVPQDPALATKHFNKIPASH